MGRPTSYQPEYAKQAEKLCQLGATDEDLADFFEVSIRTISNWKVSQPEFLQALKGGKETADERVERSLYHKAVGYTHDAVKIFQHQGTVIEAPYREHIAPDTTAAIFWLKNRRPDLWRDRQQHEHSGPDGKPVQVENTSDLDVARRIAFVFEKALKAKE